MKLQVFSVRDSKSQSYGNPFFFQTIPYCLRSLADEVNKNSESMLSAHPEDFELFHLGEFDPETSLFSLFPVPKPLAVCSTLKNGG